MVLLAITQRSQSQYVRKRRRKNALRLHTCLRELAHGELERHAQDRVRVADRLLRDEAQRAAVELVALDPVRTKTMQNYVNSALLIRKNGVGRILGDGLDEAHLPAAFREPRPQLLVRRRVVRRAPPRGLVVRVVALVGLLLARVRGEVPLVVDARAGERVLVLLRLAPRAARALEPVARVLRQRARVLCACVCVGDRNERAAST